MIVGVSLGESMGVSTSTISCVLMNAHALATTPKYSYGYKL